MSEFLLLSDGVIQSSAVFSMDRAYRFELWRVWGDKSNYCNFIGLNPSTADENADDPTIRRCIRFSKDWGFGALCMTNLFAFRATDPETMKAHPGPFGTSNYPNHVVPLAKKAGRVIAAWGKHGAHLGAAKCFLGICDLDGITLQCFRKNKDGSPEHPLYQPANRQTIPYP